ncbi:MAG: hypothetical protein C0483_17765 [Pirellula sp.]|nr:hypothetical protein [Pirellula sp.]
MVGNHPGRIAGRRLSHLRRTNNFSCAPGDADRVASADQSSESFRTARLGANVAMVRRRRRRLDARGVSADDLDCGCRRLFAVLRLPCSCAASRLASLSTFRLHRVYGMQPLQLILDPPAAGAWNMGVDEMLMERAAEANLATLRFYRWSPATLSLGYFQNAADRETHAASNACPMVRRSSGGGAIVHDHELTYSISLPTAHPLAADAETLYRNVHGTLLEALAEFGVEARLNEAALVQLAGEPFLCFQRRAVGDVLLDRYKICGSAQRRRRGAILQHGSVLLGRSAAAPELPGVIDLVDTQAISRLTPTTLAEVWIHIWRSQLSPLESYGEYSPDDLKLAGVQASTKYGSAVWTNRR